MSAALLAGCGEEAAQSVSETATDVAETATEVAETVQETAEAAETAETAAEDIDYGSGEVKVWVADNVVDFTNEQIAAFQAEHPEMSGYTFTVEAVGEGDAAGNMITDVEAGADIYAFAQDQIARLVTAGALEVVEDSNAEAIKAQNDAGAVGAATVGGTLYAYPLTSDNGYFLYYDKSVVTDPSTLEGIVADCEAAGKNFYFEINSGWYQTAFFFGTGAELTYDTDDAGNFTKCNSTYASDAGVVALKKIAELASSKAFQNGSAISNATNVGAIVDEHGLQAQPRISSATTMHVLSFLHSQVLTARHTRCQALADSNSLVLSLRKMKASLQYVTPLQHTSQVRKFSLQDTTQLAGALQT